MREGRKIHFVGVGGAGLSALAQMASWDGCAVSGSDRFFDNNQALSLRKKLEAEGIKIVPQDGSGVQGADEVVASAAVESNIPDILQARKRGIPLLLRWEFLNRMMGGMKALAVAGTNGKSTTAALLSWILEKNNFDPSMIIGANLKQAIRGLGNARRGEGEWFCFEADESDGGLTHYFPEVGIVTNITPDHFKLPRLKELFARFARNCQRAFVRNADCPQSRALISPPARSITFSVRSGADFKGDKLELKSRSSRFQLSGQQFELPLPGLHNVYNALAAVAAASSLDLSLKKIAAAVKNFPGLSRRMEIVSSGKVLIIDDYAHNAAEINAALRAARLMGERVIGVYQPPGFGPLRKFSKEVAAAFSQAARKSDLIILLPVYYGGGTVTRKFNSGDLVEKIKSRARILALPGRSELISYIRGIARKGDVILIMGARDPSLSGFCREVGENIGR